MALLTLVAALVLLWALRWPMSLSLGCYLVAELLYIPVVMLTWWMVGPGATYGWVYSIFTGAILAAVLRLAWESIADTRYRMRVVAASLVLATGYAGIAVAHLGRPLQWYDVVVLVEGATLFWAAVIVGMSAPYAWPCWPDISIGLSVLWTAQSLVDLGYCMHYPRWNAWSAVASPLIGIAGFLFLGWRLHHHHHHHHQQSCHPSAVPSRTPVL